VSTERSCCCHLWLITSLWLIAMSPIGPNALLSLLQPLSLLWYTLLTAGMHLGSYLFRS
jgi:hypothetical protein